MKLHTITVPDPRLRQKSTKARKDDPEVIEAIKAMRSECLAWEAKHPHELSAAMAAPQLGVNKRVIIVRDDLEDKDNNHFTSLLNPEIIKTDGKIESDYEGCLSIPFIYAKVPRPDKVRVKAELEDGTPVRIKADGFLARTLQHEIDHLEGVLFIDHIKDDPEAFAHMNDKGELDPIDYEKDVKNNPELWPNDED